MVMLNYKKISLSQFLNSVSVTSYKRIQAEKQMQICGLILT